MAVQATGERPGRIVIRLLIAAVLACLAQIVLAQFLTEIVAAGHATFHAVTSLIVFIVALGIAWRWRAAGWASRAPILGLSAFGVATFVESLGAYGYGPDNDGRVNGMVLLHDLGLGLTALGMIAAVVGIAIGVGIAGSRRQGALRLAMLGGAAAFGVLGGLVVKVMIGIG